MFYLFQPSLQDTALAGRPIQDYISKKVAQNSDLDQFAAYAYREMLQVRWPHVACHVFSRIFQLDITIFPFPFQIPMVIVSLNQNPQQEPSVVWLSDKDKHLRFDEIPIVIAHNGLDHFTATRILTAEVCMRSGAPMGATGAPTGAQHHPCNLLYSFL